MRPEMRAVVFDLDDTLYPFRRFQISGFAAVAAELERRIGIDRRLAFRAMHRARAGRFRGREIQACLDQYDLPVSAAPELIEWLRHHDPRLRLPRAAARMLEGLRATGWKIGVLTNGTPSIQRRKVAALGLPERVDVIVYAAEIGCGTGKPDPNTFAEVVRQLGVPTHQVMCVGNDEQADIQGARRVGLRTVRADVWQRRPAPTAADAVITRLSQLQRTLFCLTQETPAHHAA